jgi:hypothetical protein
LPLPGFGALRAGILRIEAVDQHFLDRYMQALQLVQKLEGLADNYFFPQHHRHKAAVAGILQQSLHLLHRRGQIQEKFVQFVPLIRTPEPLPHETVLGQQGVQGLEPAADQLRGGQQPQRVPGGRGIHHDEVVGPGFRPAGDGKQRHEFIQAGQGEVQDAANIRLIQEGAPGGDLGKLAPVPGLEGRQGILGIELQDL